VLAELGDTSDDSIIGGSIDKDSIVGFFFDFSLGPFLHKQGFTLAPPFFWVAAFAIVSLLFFSTFAIWL
jgi:hypothetical protein